MRISKRVYGLVYIAFIGLVIWLADIGSCQTICGPAKALPYGDKVGHFVLVGLLTAAVFFALSAKCLSVRVWSYAVQFSVAALAVTLFISLEELSQNWSPNRTADWADLFASYLGILTFELARSATGERSSAKLAK